MTNDFLTAESGAFGLVDALLQQGSTVAFAESLTAGLASAAVGGVPGASAVLRGGIVVYATDVKATLGDVPAESLRVHGAVSEITAGHLAASARRLLGADWGVSFTGVAGPDEQEGHPAGTVFVGIEGPTTGRVLKLSLTGDRWAIRLASVTAAFKGLVTELDRLRV
ncbi:CinA family protein [Hoyosella rhizosphaerae]|uniref:Competence protein n=1 Tax=Hoyosella rhizosphaerae TaxID=1755582 RepID=A0A916U4D3_9ACTN|nr:CinA family protein [Hoyosella rhizosphaerae]MBN4926327.1 CinA family protein [Hoyosella rhizosphaerae]GGC60217.1 competence protein [Hoyosella rhizosphaerae]